MRARDDVIPLEERLFRSLEIAWVDGDRVLSLAIDGEGTSCLRSRLCTAEQARDGAVALRPAENGVAVVTSAELPTAFAASNGIAYDVFSYDDPVPGNEAHCEIRWRRTTDRPNEVHLKKIGRGAKAELKVAIASVMKVAIPPAALSPSGVASEALRGGEPG